MWSKRGTDVWRTITGWFGRWRADSEGSAERSEQRSPLESLEYDPRTIERRADIYIELGLRPAQFVRRIVEEEGGRVHQQDLGRYWNFSQSTGCRLLQELEDEGAIERYRMGQEKVVTLAAETAPGTETPDTATASDPPDSATGIRRGR